VLHRDRHLASRDIWLVPRLAGLRHWLDSADSRGQHLTGLAVGADWCAAAAVVLPPHPLDGACRRGATAGLADFPQPRKRPRPGDAAYPMAGPAGASLFGL